MEITTLNRRMDLIAQLMELHEAAWPAFINANPNEHSEKYITEMADFQLLCVDGDLLVAGGNTIPIAWKTEDDMPDGWTGVIAQGVREYEMNITASALCALAIVIRNTHLGQGLSSKMVEAMKSLGRERSLTHLLAPVRPTLKSMYPLISMDDYITWRRGDGAFFDPWMRVHERLNGALVQVARDALVIEGSVSDWEAWTGQTMKSSGQYIVEGALHPVAIDVDADKGVYSEDNVWFKYIL
ncbi:MAG: GNAT family N-acetyltransferase [Deltaproteobacteria bacterium]|nr:GNAT family N-acetyltransferase [Deltaproteobacteria bacterium]MBN2670607.1 GNAT family N-acetyltransferase [Deltaproteobacteria bacterium]